MYRRLMSRNLKDSINSNSKVRLATRHILVWSYERGTLQYDIICALILLFIFLVPPSCFVSKRDNLQSFKKTHISPQKTHNGNLHNENN
jgi:hypothetical protein